MKTFNTKSFGTVKLENGMIMYGNHSTLIVVDLPNNGLSWILYYDSDSPTDCSWNPLRTNDELEHVIQKYHIDEIGYPQSDCLEIDKSLKYYAAIREITRQEIADKFGVPVNSLRIVETEQYR